MGKSTRLNVVLDEDHAIKLHRLGDRTDTNPGTIARPLVSAALLPQLRWNDDRIDCTAARSSVEFFGTVTTTR